MVGMLEADQQEDMDPSPRPFARADSGADYFATRAHYLSLARRLVAQVQLRPHFVVVTADPPPGLGDLVPALMKAAAGLYAVGVVVCGPEMKREQLLRAAPPSGTPLLVFANAEMLSDGQLGGLCEALGGADGSKPAAVLLAHPSCVTRLEQLHPRLFRDGQVSHFRLQELDREEIEIFVRRQLRSEQEPVAVTAEAMAAIADFSGGDPATVNRLARVITEFVVSAAGKSAKDPALWQCRPSTSSERNLNGAGRSIADVLQVPAEPEFYEASPAEIGSVAPPALSPQRRAGSRVRFSVVLLLGVAGLTTVPGGAVFSTVRRLVQHVAVFDGPAFGTWFGGLRAYVFAEFSGNSRGPVGRESLPENEMRVPDSIAAAPSPVVPVEEAVPGSAPVQPPAPAETAEAPAAPAQPLQPPRTELTAVAPSGSPRATAAETVALVARGDEFFAARDITSARLFYDRAANMGDGRAAFRMGATFDHAFLERAGIRGAGGDPQQALSWYNRARNLGNAEADRLLKTLGGAQ
jgi:hypothetical protein